MLIIAIVLAVLAAVLHAGLFIMQTAGWHSHAVWRRFGIASQADADTTAPLAYSLGFTSLFLAIGVIVGIVLIGIGWMQAGSALAIFALACMVAGAIVLVGSKRKRGIRMALVAGILPLAALILVILD